MIQNSIRIGQLLLQRGLVVASQIEVAAGVQRLRGGRLGSWLVVQGAAPADLVAQGLGEQQSVLAASERAVLGVTTGTLGVVPRNFCERYGILPLLVQKGTLHLAMLEPGKLDLVDHLGQVLGCAIQPYAVAEVLLSRALDRYYQIPVLDCYKHPVTGPMPATDAARQTAPAATRPPPSAPAPAAGSGGGDELQLVFLDEAVDKAAAADVDGFDIDVDLDDLSAEDLSGSFFDLKLSATDQQGDGDDEPVSIDDVLGGLRAATDRQTVLTQLLRPTMSELSLVVVFRPVKELAVALGAWGTVLDNEKVRQLRLPLLTPSLVQRCHDEQVVVRGAASEDALQPMIANYLGTEAPSEACVAPVLIKNKVVNLLCLQTATAFGDELIAQVSTLTQHAAAAYARTILQRKKK